MHAVSLGEVYGAESSMPAAGAALITGGIVPPAHSLGEARCGERRGSQKPPLLALLREAVGYVTCGLRGEHPGAAVIKRYPSFFWR